MGVGVCVRARVCEKYLSTLVPSKLLMNTTVTNLSTGLGAPHVPKIS